MVDALESRRKRLRFRAWHRGTKESDLILGRFADDNLAHLDSAELGEFEALLEQPDPLIYDWICRRSEPPPDADGAIVRRLIASVPTPPADD